MYLSLWTKIGTAEKGMKILWDSFDKNHHKVYAVTNKWDPPPEGVGGYRSLTSLLSLRHLTQD